MRNCVFEGGLVLTVCERQNKISEYALFVLLFIQPCLDVISYFFNGSGATLALRMAIFAAVTLLAFAVSDKKGIYLILSGILLVYYALHLTACVSETVVTRQILFSDLANYIRVAQIPVFTLCFISFSKKGENPAEYIENALLCVFFIIIAVEAVSFITGTNPYTYPNKSIGLLGWFYYANSQSAIISAIFALVLPVSLKKGKLWFTVLVSVLGFAQLWLFATRLAFLSIFVVGIGTLIVWLICRRIKFTSVLIILICTIICAALYPLSPMKINQDKVSANALLKQQNIDALVQKGIDEYGKEGYEYLTYAYDEYLEGLPEKYGLERVASLYDYSTDVSDIADVRRMKINYCRLAMEDAPLTSRLFGLCYDSMTYDGHIYDVENDFHGIIYLYGYVGFGLFMLMLCFFAFLILKALLTDAKKYFTVEAGATGVALITLLYHAYQTSGVLRRPNASFYLSLTLGGIYYLTRIKNYGDKTEK